MGKEVLPPTEITAPLALTNSSAETPLLGLAAMKLIGSPFVRAEILLEFVVEPSNSTL
jgi:hypothetical protein